VLFSSPEFVFLFLPITFIVFATLMQWRQSVAIGWLVSASLAFYGYWNIAYLALLVPSILLNYAVGRIITNLSGYKRRAAMIIGVAGNLGVLLYFKYVGFLVANLDAASGASFAIPRIVLPLGISFITFQKIAYVVDTYKGKAHDRGLLRFSLFVSFFPQLIAGPIAHHSEILPQLGPSLRLSSRNVAVGLSLFAVGLFKKVMIADGVSYISDAVFAISAKGGQASFLTAWAGALAFTMQLYFDFSGYSDMACGLSMMFGIRLPINFYSPYKSDSIIEFWRRWHISLSRFLRDYLYIPLGGNRRGPVRRYVNLLITMTLGGLWHGAGWTFVIWGAYHGTLLLINHAWRSMPTAPSLGKRVSVAITFLAVVVGWVMFKADHLSTAMDMYRAMLAIAPIGTPESFTLGAPDWAKLIGALGFVWLLPNSYQIFARYHPALGQVERTRWRWIEWRPRFIWAGAAASCIAMTMMPVRPVLSFLYFQF
jgi:alginate O-acetyltransferase complex protein AlgI